MSSLGPLAPNHNPFADDNDEENPTKPASSLGGEADQLKTFHDAGTSNNDLAGLQQQYWNNQDQHLDTLSASLNRQHELSLQLNEELDLHHELLEEFDRDADGTGLRLGGASSQLDRLRNSLKDHGMIYVLGALIILLIILIARFK
ncbi:uncharacterized protein MEPE_01620 [Melanopsichium pennsylvanicum]|uniref:t-SNARE coiled-coil homology domain-containing protein n=2 Tax=Melanopsichium pennsylvanicum TaxID=63383 RepID=A0AAJ4XHX5_9BASI|nr:syntaxin-like protein [Melanopsichium pennsylvanicum 4]SNX82914.1 uncharacterized protein MEPE_01620 [Melanopsichium pennsylvanicum]